MIVLNLYYRFSTDCKNEFLEEIFDLGIPQKTREEDGCIEYNFYSSFDANEILLVEKWRDAAALDEHKKQEHLKQLIGLKEKYSIETVCNSYEA